MGLSPADAATENSAAVSTANAMPPRRRRGRFALGDARQASPVSNSRFMANEKLELMVCSNCEIDLDFISAGKRASSDAVMKPIRYVHEYLLQAV
jgi:hypothetical protein